MHAHESYQLRSVSCCVQSLVQSCGLGSWSLWTKLQSVLLDEAAAAVSDTGTGRKTVFEARPGESRPEQTQRRAALKLAMLYRKLRQEKGEWDLADYTHHVLAQLHAAGKQANPVSQVSVPLDCT